jgi:hypothetical protein
MVQSRVNYSSKREVVAHEGFALYSTHIACTFSHPTTVELDNASIDI